MLIAAVMPIMSIYRLPHGQYGYSGHVVNLPQDAVSFASSLPRLPSELDVVVRKEGANQSHRDQEMCSAPCIAVAHYQQQILHSQSSPH